MNQLKDLLEKLYPGQGEVLQDRIAEMIRGEMVDEKIDPRLRGDDKKGGDDNFDDWYKRLQMYVVYPDTFSIGTEKRRNKDTKEQKGDFNSLTEKLGYIKDLGCNAIHVLPFLESPMVDQGFDVSDYFKVRKDLGGNEAFEKFLDKANKMGLKVFMDLVLNHVSDQHEWFKRAGGSSYAKASEDREKYRDFFIWQKEKPELITTYEKEGMLWARYGIRSKIKDQKSKRRSLRRIDKGFVDLPVVFPEFVGELPHWRYVEGSSSAQGYGGRGGFWYFHTFYPQQLDLNWNNPELFLEMSKVLIYWTKKGLSFRLDAIGHLGKDEITHEEDMGKTHLIIRALHTVMGERTKKAVFLVEVGDKVNIVLDYLRTEKGTGAELGYNFELNTMQWWSLIFKDVDKLWKVLDRSQEISDWSQWVTFLRNHDALSLWYLKEFDRTKLWKQLKVKGMRFESSGVAGRTASFLDGDERRIIMAYFLLASLPGNPAIIYRDELGIRNKELKGGRDTREINRGQIGVEELKNKSAEGVYEQISRIFKKRMEYVEMIANGRPERVDAADGIFGCKYGVKTSMLILVNLGDKQVKIPLRGTGDVLLSINGGKFLDREVVLPGYAGIWIKTGK